MSLIVRGIHSGGKWALIYLPADRKRSEKINYQHVQLSLDSTFNLSGSQRKTITLSHFQREWCRLAAAAIALSLSRTASVSLAPFPADWCWTIITDHHSLSLMSLYLITEAINLNPIPPTITDIALPLCSLQWQVPLTVAVGNASSVCSQSLIWINNKTGRSCTPRQRASP